MPLALRTLPSDTTISLFVAVLKLDSSGEGIGPGPQSAGVTIVFYGRLRLNGCTLYLHVGWKL